MRIPYRTRRALGRFFIVVLVLIVVALLVWACWMIWLGRFVVYTDNGIYFDFDRSSMDITGQPAVPPPEKETVSIYYNEGENAVERNPDLTQLNGYYISTAELKGDLGPLKEQLQQLPPNETAIMLEVKNAFGEFNYSTSVSAYYNSSVDRKAVDSLIDYLHRNGYYTIARVTAFQDYNYGLNNVDEGLFSTGGAYLWRDDLGCYSLSPSSNQVITHLVQIGTELRALGFDEVVFDQFLFPDSKGYRFSGDKQEALNTAAATLAENCATNYFAVSFVSTTDLAVPTERSRLYLKDVEAGFVDNAASQTTVLDPTIHLVFLTEFHDTRYDAYGVLRPITAMK